MEHRWSYGPFIMSRRMHSEDDADPSVLAIVVAVIVGFAAVVAVYALIEWLG